VLKTAEPPRQHDLVSLPITQARLPISQDEIGRMAGLSRQNANRALHDFEQTGLVRTRYGAIEVLDLEGRHAYSR
jgi:CRP/FNR family cyclic AMP-dependent transcriptional regulator